MLVFQCRHSSCSAVVSKISHSVSPPCPGSSVLYPLPLDPCSLVWCPLVSTQSYPRHPQNRLTMQQSPPSLGHHAIVFGCSGINGWALVNQLLSDYPAPGIFSKVTAVANRAFTSDEAQWPTDDRLQIVSGVDLLVGDDAVLGKTLAEKIPSVETISHVYYAGEDVYHCSLCPAVRGRCANRARLQHIAPAMSLQTNAV